MAHPFAGPMPATVEEYDSDNSVALPETREFATKFQRSQLGKDAPAAPTKEGGAVSPIDAASDSGYSSHTHATAASLDAIEASASRNEAPPAATTEPPLALSDRQPTSIDAERARSMHRETQRSTTLSTPSDTRLPSSSRRHFRPSTPPERYREADCAKCQQAASLTSRPSPFDRVRENDYIHFGYPRHLYDYHNGNPHSAFQGSSMQHLPDIPSLAGPAPRPSVETRTRPRPVSYHAGMQMPQNWDAYATQSLQQGPTQPSPYYDPYGYYSYHPAHYPTGVPQSTGHRSQLSPIIASPLSPGRSATRPPLPHSGPEGSSAQRYTPVTRMTNSKRESTQSRQSLRSATENIWFRRPSAHTDRMSRLIDAVLDSDSTWSSDSELEQQSARHRTSDRMPSSSAKPFRRPSLKHSSTAPPVSAREGRHHSRRSLERPNTVAGHSHKQYRYAERPSIHQDLSSSARDTGPQESPSHSRRPSVAKNASGRSPLDTDSKSSGGARVIVETHSGRRYSCMSGDQRAKMQGRHECDSETGQGKDVERTNDAEAYQAKTSGLSVTNHMRTHSSSSYQRPASAHHRSRSRHATISVVSAPTAGQRSHHSRSGTRAEMEEDKSTTKSKSNRHSFDGASRVSRTSTGEYRIRVDSGTTVQFHGDMAGRTISFQRSSDGRGPSELIVGGPSGGPKRGQNRSSGTEKKYHERTDGARRSSRVGSRTRTGAGRDGSRSREHSKNRSEARSRRESSAHDRR